MHFAALFVAVDFVVVVVDVVVVVVAVVVALENGIHPFSRPVPSKLC